MSDKKLTDKEERFAQLFVMYGNATKAYREVYETTTDNDQTVWDSAYKVKRKPEVAHRIEELRAQYIEEHYSVERRLKTLQDVIDKCTGEKSIRISSKEGPLDVRSFKPMYVIQAVNEMNKMLGGHAPMKVEEKSESTVTHTELQTPQNGREGPAFKGKEKDES